MMNSVSRLSQTILEAYPQRFTLSPNELATLNQLANSMIPIEKQLQWVQEILKAKQKPRLSNLLRQLSQKQQQWQKTHIGSGYTQEAHVSRDMVQKAFTELIKKVHLQTFEHNDHIMLDIFSWLEKRLQECAQLCKQDTQVDPTQLLKQLDQTLCDKVLYEISPILLARIEKQMLDAMKVESVRARPQDLMVSQRLVIWSMLRIELNIPQLYLNLYGSW